ncbi:hypothetical protein Tco_0690690 [Tanacetum coccineum]
MQKPKINNVKNELRNEMQSSIQASMSNQTNELKNMMASFFQMNTASTSGSRSLPSNTIANPKEEWSSVPRTLADLGASINLMPLSTNPSKGIPTSSPLLYLTYVTGRDVNDDFFVHRLDEHTLDYSSPPLWDDYNDELLDLKTVNDNTYDDPFDSEEEKIKESKLLIDELDLPGLSDFLPSPECDSVFYEDFSEVDALPSTKQ